MKLGLFATSFALPIVAIEASKHAELHLATKGELSIGDKNLLSFLGWSSSGRSKVIDLIVNEYTAKASSVGSSKDTGDWITDAMEAIELSETDGEPVPIKGHDFLYVGSVGASRNKDFIQQHNITHIVNWSTTARCNLFDDIEYLCTGVKGRKGMYRHINELDEAVEFVRLARQAGGRILSHCWQGKNRSVTLLVAYLMKYEGMGPKEANNLIKETRPQAKPYWDSLEMYSKHLDTLS